MSQEEINQQFEELYEKWNDQTMFHSATHFMKENENYKKILALGNEIIWPIGEKLRNGGNPFLTLFLADMFPGVITVTGYVSPVEYADEWVKLIDLLKLEKEKYKIVVEDE